jgi:hypothetical protein
VEAVLPLPTSDGRRAARSDRFWLAGGDLLDRDRLQAVHPKGGLEESAQSDDWLDSTRQRAEDDAKVVHGCFSRVGGLGL